jgi:HK97 gp10 family phage protein
MSIAGNMQRDLSSPLTFTIKGLRELELALQAVPIKFARNVARGSLNKAGMVYKRAAVRNLKANKTMRTGALAKSIKVSTRLFAYSAFEAGKPVGKVAVKEWYGHFIEGGTQAHEIKAVRAEYLSVGNGTRKSVQHPGITAKPFFRPAFDQESRNAVLAAADYIKMRLEKGDKTSGPFAAPDATWRDDEPYA